MASDVIPDGISKEAWEEARAVVSVATIQPQSFWTKHIAKAIMDAEARATERAAQIAEHLNGWGNDCGKGGHAEHIARVIRNQNAAPNHANSNFGKVPHHGEIR